jgi:hypothetical protein
MAEDDSSRTGHGWLMSWVGEFKALLHNTSIPLKLSTLVKIATFQQLFSTYFNT